MEIPKYRVWVTGAEIMYQPHEAWINNGEVWLSNAKGWPEKKVAADKVILSRATGYKDHNGVEMFKGDILKINDTMLKLTMTVLVSLYRLSKRLKKIKSIRISLSF